MSANHRIHELLGEAKKLAIEYRELTQKPLDITGGVAEEEAARILGLTFTPHAAIEDTNGVSRRLQIKGRLLNDGKSGQRLGSIDTKQNAWDAVLMVLLDQNLDAIEIYEADRETVEDTLAGGKSDMTVSKFKAISTLRWRRGEGPPRTAQDVRNDRFLQPADEIRIVSRARDRRRTPLDPESPDED